MFAVITESMKPKYIKGDVLISKKVDPKTIKEGDVVVYLGKKEVLKIKLLPTRLFGLMLTKKESMYLEQKVLQILLKTHLFQKIKYMEKLFIKFLYFQQFIE